MTWIDIIIAVLLALAFNTPALLLYIGMAFYFYLLNGYTFRQDIPKIISWSECLTHVPNMEKTTNLLCKKGCCSYTMPCENTGDKVNADKNQNQCR